MLTPPGEYPRDAQLVTAIAHGDRRALAVLYDEYAQPLYAFGFRRLGDAGLAEELVQLVLLKVWHHARRYEVTRGSVRTWVFAIARNASIDLARARARQPRTELLDSQETTAASDELERLLRAEVVRTALRRLSEDHRRVLELVYFRAFTHAEAAQQLGLPVGTVKSRTYYALKTLRLALEELGELEEPPR